MVIPIQLAIKILTCLTCSPSRARDMALTGLHRTLPFPPGGKGSAYFYIHKSRRIGLCLVVEARDTALALEPFHIALYRPLKDGTWLPVEERRGDLKRAEKTAAPGLWDWRRIFHQSTDVNGGRFCAG
jgi:hypothetical protein